MLEHLVAEHAVARVVALGGLVAAALVLGNLPAQLAALLVPLEPSAVHDPHVVVAEKPEDPERVGRPPVALVAVQHDGGVPVGADPVHQRLEALSIQVVAA
jgi:hypothetical protein